ncbi:hypothetical protein KFD70_00310 [Bacillus pfraonensis]|uniref:hypothetical protein n=1 Tax=Bacillus TaxID=1386 RepID=UPI002A5265FD|nr:hypothetical protein [Bacillus pseudomycoides]
MIVGNLSYELLSPDLTGALVASLMTSPLNAISLDIFLKHKGEEVTHILEGNIVFRLQQIVQ